MAVTNKKPIKKIKKKYNTQVVLTELNKLQDNIILVCRPSTEHGWDDRCIYLGENYIAEKDYNHRTILNCEVVIEYDFDNIELNYKLAEKVIERFEKFGITYAKYKSGNKSCHVHTYINIPEGVTDLALLKKTFMRYFGEMYYDRYSNKYYFEKPEIPKPLFNGWVKKDNFKESFFWENPKEVNRDLYIERIQKLNPDMSLAHTGHPIRLEFGLHEKTGRHKTLLKNSEDYIKLNDIPECVLFKYGKEKERLVKWATTHAINNLDEHKIIKDILNVVKFREDIGDGRERVLFILIHVLKKNHTKESLTKFLQDWYRYSGGRKLSSSQISSKVNYHWNRTYNIGLKYLKELCEELGVDV